MQESKLFPTLTFLDHFADKDAECLVFLYFMTLHLLRCEIITETFAQSYAQRTLRFNGEFEKENFGCTDLYQLLYKINTTSQSNPLHESDIKRFLRNIQSATFQIHTSSQLLLRFENNLHIKITNYKSIRRIIGDWDQHHVDHEAKSLVVTRLLQAFRARARNSDLLASLLYVAKHDDLELENVDNPELQSSLSQHHDRQISGKPEKKLGLLKFLAKTAGLGVAAYMVGRALARGSITPLEEDASAGASSSGSIASVANPFGGISRRPNLFGWLPEQATGDSGSEPETKKKRWLVKIQRPNLPLLDSDNYIIYATTANEAKQTAQDLLSKRVDLGGCKVIAVDPAE